jgi:O-antigen/teichoic acid export membrane protein
VIRSYGVKATRDASIYGMGVGAMLPFGLVTLAVTTRYLDPSGYGRLATLMATASILALVAGLGVIQGTLMLTYRSGGDDGVDGGDYAGVDEAAPEEELSSDERRRLLGSGIVFSAFQGAIVCLPFVFAAEPISDLMLGDPTWAPAVRWMALSVFTAAIWRMAHQIWRMERHPVLWVWFQLARPLLVLVGIVLAFQAGFGLEAPLVATALGTALVVVISLVASFPWYILRPGFADYLRIWKRGRGLVPIQIASVVQSNIAILVLSALAPAATVGVVAVAMRIAQVPSFFGHGVLIAWPPLSSSPIGMALDEASEEREGQARVFSLLVLGTLSLLVVVSLGANALVRIAAPAYAEAADYVPLLAAGLASLVVFRGIYRAARFPGRRLWYVGLHFFWIFPYMGMLVSILEVGEPGWAVILAEFFASIVVCAILGAVDRFGPTPTPFRWRQLLTIAAVAILATVGVVASPTDGYVRAALAVAAVLAIPVLLIRTGVLPRHQAELIRDVVVDAVPKRMSSRILSHRLGQLRPEEWEAVELLVWQGAEAELAAQEVGASQSLLLARMVRGLRRLGGEEEPTPHDASIGRYLLRRGSTMELDEVARRLAKEGVDPLELHMLERSLTVARRLRRRSRRTLDRARIEDPLGARS